MQYYDALIKKYEILQLYHLITLIDFISRFYWLCCSIEFKKVAVKRIEKVYM